MLYDMLLKFVLVAQTMTSAVALGVFTCTAVTYRRFLCLLKVERTQLCEKQKQ